MSAPGLPFCVECKVNIEPNNAWGAVCSQQCNDVREAYQRGRDEERAKALSGADAYLKQAITEATEQAYAMGRDWSRVNERNRIADALELEAVSKHPTHSASVSRASRMFCDFAARLRKGEV